MFTSSGSLGTGAPGGVDVVIVSMGVIIREYEESEEMFEGGTVGMPVFKGWAADWEPEKPRKQLEGQMG